MRNKHSSQLVLSLLFLSLKLLLVLEMAMSQNTTIPVNVGVVLDMDTLFGRMSLSCISLALSDFYASHGNYSTRLVLHTRDSKEDVVGAAAATLDLIKNVEVQAIIGPVSSMQADFVIDIGDKARVPIFTFSATSPSLSLSSSPYFFRGALNDSSQVKAIAAIINAFGWKEVVPVYVDNEFGEGFIPFLNDALQEVDARVPYRSVIPPSPSDDQIKKELYNLMTMQTRVFIVHMLSFQGSRFFEKAEEIGMMSKGYAWIVTNGIGNVLSKINSSVIIHSMQGVVGVKVFVPKSKVLEDLRVRWKRKFQQDNPTTLIGDLDIFGLWAYDAAWALAMAVEKVNATNFSFLEKTNNISSNSTDLDTLGTSRIGPKLRDELSSTQFKGVAGDFHLVNGELQSLAFELLNVIGNGEKRIGFWTPRNGISRELNLTDTTPYSISNVSLRSIVWPGDTDSVPKGWVIPTNGKRLRIGVPVKGGFSEFVKVTKDFSTNTTTVTGYCIDVFKAALEAMPYAVPYDFIPFALPNGTSSGSYNDLAYQVYIKNYDAVVGDLTILRNRSSYVDFTLPYTDSGVSLVVPVKDQRNKNAWVFLDPLTMDLWVAICCFSVFIGFIVWVLEHRINEDFRGPPTHQAGMIFWFSTFVFAHQEKVQGNMAKLMVIVWVLVVLILTQSYAASLSSILTVQQLKPTFTDVNELIKKGEYVGMQKGSFVLALLKKMGFHESKIREYSSLTECDEAFAKGSGNGGIAAAFDETPYMRLFIGHYCSKYTLVGPVYKTHGFGFAFARGSPLVLDVSRAILTVTESDIMARIETAWFGAQTSCPDPNNSDFSKSLSLQSFRGLFLIAGIISILVLVMFAGMLLQEHLSQPNFEPNSSIWRKLVLFFRRFDQVNVNHHAMIRRNELRNRHGGIQGNDGMSHAGEAIPNNNPPRAERNGGIQGNDGMGHAGEATPNNNPTRAESPSTSSNHMNRNSVSLREQGRTLTEYGETSSSRQTPQESEFSIELTNVPNYQDRPGTSEITHESN